MPTPQPSSRPEATGGRWGGPAGYRRLIGLAAPMLVSMGAFSIMQFCDRTFLSWRSAEEIAAAVPASSVALTVSTLFFGTAVYTGTFVAQYHGARRDDRIGAAIWAGLWIALFGQGALLLSALFAEPLFSLFRHSPQVQELEVAYFRISSFGIGAQMASTVLGAFYSGRGHTRPVMWMGCIMAALNIPLDYAFIFGNWGAPELGIRGAALSTVACQWLGLFVWIGLVFRKEHDARYRLRAARGFDRDQIARLLRFGLPNGCHFLVDGAAWTVFILLVGNLGMTQLAASNIAWQIHTLALLPTLGIGIATGILVGQFQGARQPELAVAVTRSGVILALGHMMLLASVMILAPGLFLWPFQAGAEAPFAHIESISTSLLSYVALLGIAHAVQMTYAAALKGAGDVGFIIRVLSVSSLYGFVLPLAALVYWGAALSNLWGWFVGYAAIMAVVFRQRFVRGRWRELRVIEVEPLIADSACSTSYSGNQLR